MSKYKIGITEAGDAGLDLSWADKLDGVDGAVLVTKCISPQFIDAVLRHKDKVIVHATVTGYGGTVIEKNIPEYKDSLVAAQGLVCAGFPREKMVIRIDPIIPDSFGISTAKQVFRHAILMGFTRFRVSIIDMYPHSRKRFAEAGIECPYGAFGFSPNKYQINAVNQMLADVKEKYSDWNIRIEACAEPGLTEATQCGCIDPYLDLPLLGLEVDDGGPNGFQRKNCLCYAGKTELLTNKKRCPHKCLYCYWRD